MKSASDIALRASDKPITAIATAPGTAGICVLRVSGVGALVIGDRLAPELKPLPSQRLGNAFFHVHLADPLTGESLDDVVMLIFRAPHSYTGEDVLEIQGHGGHLPARRLLAAVLACGARLAEPGEFTQRAFLNGRMDLIQAEAVCDFIQAKTERAAQVARAQLDGSLGQALERLYQQGTDICADVERLLDFDDDEVALSFMTQAAQRVAQWVQALEALAATWHEGHLLRDGALVVISGRPNAGKSSLLNALLKRNRAIVHELPGTTRDVIEESYALNGIPLRLVDTAGLRETQDVVEQEGITRARDLIAQADLNLHLVDLSTSHNNYTCVERAALSAHNTLLCFTKSDLPFSTQQGHGACWPSDFEQLKISVKTGDGLTALCAAMERKLDLHSASDDHPVVALRHVTALRTAITQGQSAGKALADGPMQLVFAAEHLKTGAEALGQLLGRVYSEDLLDSIFARFCVGK